MDRTIIDKVNSGIGLTDAELDEAITFYEEMYDGLSLLGAPFIHAASAVYVTYDALRHVQAKRHRESR